MVKLFASRTEDPAAQAVGQELHQDFELQKECFTPLVSMTVTQLFEQQRYTSTRQQTASHLLLPLRQISSPLACSGSSH